MTDNGGQHTCPKCKTVAVICDGETEWYDSGANMLDFTQRHTGLKREDLLSFVLWNHTAYPMEGLDGTTSQLKKWKRQADGGLSNCVWCGKGYRHPSGKICVGGECGKCEFSMMDEPNGGTEIGEDKGIQE